MMVIVPNELRDEINRRLNAAYLDAPDAEQDREHHYTALLSHFNEHGAIPDFSLQKSAVR